MTLKHSMLVLVAGFAAWFFWRQLAIRERALAQALAVCEKNNVQLLDQGIGFARFKLHKGRRGGWVLWREYVFEFTSTGEQRYKGRVFFEGETFVRTQLDAFRESL